MSAQFLVFDLETVGLPLDGFDESQQEYLLRSAQTEDERSRKIDEFALSPLTGKIVCIGMQEMSKDSEGAWVSREVAYSVDPDMTDDDARIERMLPTGAKLYITSERVMLHNFWRYIANNRTIHLISFNGRNFDAPWLMLRSAVLGIKPTRNLMDGTRFNYSLHTDLLDKLTFFSPSATGATRRFNFDFYAKSFGIESPKAAGVDGSKVGLLFENKQIDDIAEYCLRDVRATWQLYLKWDELLR